MANTREIVNDNPIRGLRTFLHALEANFLAYGYYLSPDTVEILFEYRPSKAREFIQELLDTLQKEKAAHVLTPLGGDETLSILLRVVGERFHKNMISNQKAVALMKRVAFFKPRTRGLSRELPIWQEAMRLAVWMNSTKPVTEAEKELALKREAYEATQQVVQQRKTEKTKNTSFPRFGSLPSELKIKIWQIAALDETSLARLKFFWGLPPRLLPSSRIPVVFQVNQESRAEATKVLLNLNFADRFKIETQAHISPNHGLLLLGSYNTDRGPLNIHLGAEALKCLAAYLSESERSGIKNLGIEIQLGDLTTEYAKEFANALSQFPRLETLVVKAKYILWSSPSLVWQSILWEIGEIMKQVDVIQKTKVTDWNEFGLWALIDGKAGEQRLHRNDDKIEWTREENLPAWYGQLGTSWTVW